MFWLGWLSLFVGVAGDDAAGVYGYYGVGRIQIKRVRRNQSRNKTILIVDKDNKLTVAYL